MSAVNCFGGKVEKAEEEENEEIQQPDNIQRVPLADPSIVFYEDVYYAYGTSAGDGIAVYTSSDMKYWKKETKLALHKNDVWANRWFWAPEVYYINGKFYMYYSADEHICVATSDSPLGPFTQEIKKPMMDDKGIDNSLFIDNNGKAYLFYVRFTNGNEIWVAELQEDLKTVKTETLRSCISVSQDWEKAWLKVTEGPFVIKRNGTYYMTYSANNYQSTYYGIGVATATDVKGPWKKYEQNPVYQNVKGLVGVGHSTMFTDKEGNLRIVFHAHNSQISVQPRYMYISRVYFEKKDGKEFMKIDPDYITPALNIQ
jgi:beta-xylosidase